MQQRVPLLFVTGALAFGTLGYFLFLYDDGTMPHANSHNMPTHRMNSMRPAGMASAGAGLMAPGSPAAPAAPAATGEAPPSVATTPNPAEPPE
jgi:hypothetical protein